MGVGMKKIHRYLDIRHKKHLEDWDTVIVVEGDVGIGKSNLSLNMLEYWMEKIYGKCEPEHIRHMSLTTPSFLNDLADGEKLDMCVYDEAGELTSRRAMSKFNVKLMVGYKVIRADNIFTILVIDDVFDLDPYFRKKRVKALFSVQKRGKVAIWLKDRFRAMLSLNQGLDIKNRFLVPPSFRDSFPIYKGIMAKEYNKLKIEKTTEARKSIRDSTKEDQKVKEISEKIKLKMLKKQIKELEQDYGEIPEYD